MKKEGKKINKDTVPDFDLNRYLGTWYKIARYDHYFEKGLHQVSATYAIRTDGKITVLNEGYKKGKHKQIFGKAYQPDKNDPGKLKVSFFLWFYSDYYILELDDDYQFAVVGSSSENISGF